MYKKLILNGITLLVTSFLLVLTILAWYTSNREVNANGIIGSTGTQEPIVEEVNIYYATKVNDTTYTKGDLVSTGDQMIYDQFPEVYDPNAHDSIIYHEPPRLVELVLKQGKQVTSLDLVSETSIFPGMDNTTNPGYVLKDDLTDGVNIALSPFLKFGKATLNENTITISSFSGIQYNETTGVSSQTTLRIINESISPRVYILFDFDDEKFNWLYSNNIGNNVIDTADQINHFLDFKLLIIGGDVQ